MEFLFSHPVYLGLLFLIPVMVFIHFFSIKTIKRKAVVFSNFEAVAKIKGIDLYSKNITILILSCMVVLLLSFSAAGAYIKTDIQTSSNSFIIAIDSSASMEANDIEPNRIEAAKSTAEDFVNSAPLGTKIGVVSFSGNSLIEQSPTEDKILVKNSIENINISFIGGTDIYEAITTSTNLLQNEESKVVILISDGQTNVGSIESAIEYAKKNSVKIHTIEIGTAEGGETSYGLSQIDEEVLKAIAYNTGGTFFVAKSKNELANSFNMVLELKERNVAIPISNYLIIFALILFIIEYLLLNTRYSIFP